MSSERQPAPPPLLWTLCEGRAVFEFGAFLFLNPYLSRLPSGDGHPVMVLPGLLATDLSTRPIRHVLDRLGYATYGWGLGRNKGLTGDLEKRIAEQVVAIGKQHESRVSFIGWSLGGTYAREIAKMIPEQIRCVITMGSPITSSRDYAASFARPIGEAENGMSQSARHARMQRLHIPPPVPTTIIYSKTDGIVASGGVMQKQHEANPQTENIEVSSSHLGLGVHPRTVYVIADRLRQTPETWTPFRSTDP